MAERTDSGMEQAAAAFDAVMQGTGQPGEKPSEKKQTVTERMFSPGDFSPDNEDDRAGGDDLPAPGEVSDEEEAPPPKKKKPEPEEPDEEEEEGVEEEEEGGEEEEEGDEEKAEDDSPRYMVLVDGEEKEVSLNEALQGYIRTETFHQRLNKLSEANTAVQEQYKSLSDDRAKYQGMLADLETTMSQLIPAEPDWDKLFAENPANARAMQKQYEELKGKLGNLRKERERVSKEQADADAAELKKFAETELRKFFSHDKKWVDAKVLRRDLDAMRATALQLGFSEQEISTVYDSRMLRVLLKASKYDRLMAAKPVPVKKGKQPVKPGTGNKGTVHRGFTQAQKRLSRSGSIEDATEVFQNILRR